MEISEKENKEEEQDGKYDEGDKDGMTEDNDHEDNILKCNLVLNRSVHRHQESNENKFLS